MNKPARIGVQSFDVGDLVPRFVLPDRSGQKIDFGHQSRAGRIVVLGIGKTEDLEGLAAVQDRLPRSADVVAYRLAIGAQPGDAALTDDSILPDPSGVMTQAFAVGTPAWVVLDAGFRVALKRAHDDNAGDAVAAVVERVLDRSRPDLVRAQAPVLIIPDLFEPAFCEQLLEHWESGRKVTDLISASGGDLAGGRADALLKRRSDVPVDDEALTHGIRQRLSRRALPQIKAACQRDVDHFETFRVGCYDAGNKGHFGRHRDNTTPFTAHRLFALTANLNGDYEGGEVIFPEFGQTRYRPDPGGGLVFSCTLLHEALPVTGGRRFGLFGFLFDRAGAQHVSRVMAQEKAAGRDPEAAWR